MKQRGLRLRAGDVLEAQHEFRRKGKFSFLSPCKMHLLSNLENAIDFFLKKKKLPQKIFNKRVMEILHFEINFIIA